MSTAWLGDASSYFARQLRFSEVSLEEEGGSTGVLAWLLARKSDVGLIGEGATGGWSKRKGGSAEFTTPGTSDWRCFSALRRQYCWWATRGAAMRGRPR